MLLFAAISFGTVGVVRNYPPLVAYMSGLAIATGIVVTVWLRLRDERRSASRLTDEPPDVPGTVVD
ncbi:hypothetical protein [Longispora urticae]